MKSKSIIREILSGNCSIESIKMSETYNKLMVKLITADEQLQKEFAANEKLMQLYKRYQDVCDELSMEETAIFFEEGVKLGLRLGIQTAGK